MSTLEQNLERRLARYGEGDFVVKQLRRQIAANNSGQSAQDLYVTGAVKKGAAAAINRFDLPSSRGA